LAVRTRSSNPRASASVWVGLASVAAVPAGILLARYTAAVTLLDSSGSVLVAAGLAVSAIVLARRGREHLQRTLGRAGGGAAAGVGRALGVLGLCIAITAALSLGVFGLLSLLAS
jgi:hypothetical protein